VPLKKLKLQETQQQPASRTRLHQQPDAEINDQRLKSKRVRRSLLQPNSDPKDYTTQHSGYKREENKSVSSRRINPRDVNPKSTSPLVRRVENSQAPIVRHGVNSKLIDRKKGVSSLPFQGESSKNFAEFQAPSDDCPANPKSKIQNPKSGDVGRGRKGRSQIEIPSFPPLKALANSPNRRRDNNQSRIAALVPRAPAQGGTLAARPARQGSGSQPAQSQRIKTSRRPQKGPSGLLVYIIRLLILGIGIGAIAGTLLSALNPSTQASVKRQDTTKTQVQQSPSPGSLSTPLPLTQEISPLKSKIQTLVAQNPALQAGVFLVDLDTGAYLDQDASSTFASASTIKFPILVAFFQDVDAGKLRLDELLTMKPEMIADGSGDLQYKQPGTQYTALEVVTKMITISDNTATNILIERLGGIEALNQRFRSWGLTTTVLRNRLPDVAGTNSTSPKELANLMFLVHQGQLVSLGSRDRMLDIMQRTETNSLLPKGLGVGATIAHKTGNIGSLVADVGLVDIPTGKRYIVAVMVKRPHNDTKAEELIRQISRTVYDYFNQPRATPTTTSMPSRSTGTLTRAIASENPVN
jgi:beta-lactamase class A